MSEENFLESLNKLLIELKEYYTNKGLTPKLVAHLPDKQKQILGNAFYREKRLGYSLTKKQKKLIEKLKEV